MLIYKCELQHINQNEAGVNMPLLRLSSSTATAV